MGERCTRYVHSCINSMSSGTAADALAAAQLQGRAAPHASHGKHGSGSGAVNTLADLVSTVRRTKGDIPPPLVGFTSTVLTSSNGDHIYVWGGRLVHVRRMVADLWTLDLRTLMWEKKWPMKESIDVGPTIYPNPRYFHSATAWNSKLVIFGGMGQDMKYDVRQPRDRPPTPEGHEGGPDPSLSVLNDILVYDSMTGLWTAPEVKMREGLEPPLARYAHLSTITNGCLIILGGQDILNRYIEQVCCLDLDTMTWVHTQKWKGHVGTYRSIATSRSVSVHAGGGAPNDSARPDTASSIGRENANSLAATLDASGPAATSLIDETLQLPYSAPPDPDEPVYTFTNYNFAEVRREFDMLSAPTSPDWTSTVTSLSDVMIGNPSLPPGLRFPTASMVGQYMVLTGTLITQQVSSFAIWVLDLSKARPPFPTSKRPRLPWTKIDAGHTLRTGSWNRAVTWKNNVVILGDRDREIAVDYNRRQNNFTHIVFVDLETFGFYQPPAQVLPLATQEFGLALLNNPALSDFDVTCSDGVRLPCSRNLLEARWPWFQRQSALHRDKFDQASPLEGVGQNGQPAVSRGEGSVKARELHLPAKSPIAQALLQYFYTLNIITPLQLSVNVLVGLLVLSQKYETDHLRSLVVHALHVHLSNGQGSPAAIYEAATLGRALALQTRALKLMMNHNAAAVAAKSKLRQRPPDIDTSRGASSGLGLENS